MGRFWFAELALLAWPVVALCLYRTLPIGRATIWTILGGYLLLPVGGGFKFEMVPALDKNSIPVLAALVGCTLVVRRLPRPWTSFGLPEALVLAFVFSPVVTAMLNGDAIIVGGRVLPGVGLYDGLSTAISQAPLVIPFLLGRQFLRDPDDNEDLLRALTVAGLAYSLPMMFEVRMSPQLHTWVYGYFPHSFLQQIRDGGFRPVVFMGHGLLVAFFAMTTVVASTALWRTQTRVLRLPPSAVTFYLGTMLILCKTGSDLVYGAVLAPLVRLASAQLQLKVAVLMVSLALLYPTLRAADLIPQETILSLSASVSVDRAQSLAVRLVQEKRLLDRASERFFFGWGRWGRNRNFNAQTGQDASVTDGLWILTMGQYGYVGFLAQFGLFALTVFRATFALKSIASDRERIFLAALALIVAINVIDQLPNSTTGPWTWLLAGALLGRAEDAHRALAPRTRVAPA